MGHRTNTGGGSKEAEPVLTQREQAMSAKGTAVGRQPQQAQASSSKRNVSHSGPGGGSSRRRTVEERGISLDGKQLPDEQSQTKKHQNIYL